MRHGHTCSGKRRVRVYIFSFTVSGANTGFEARKYLHGQMICNTGPLELKFEPHELWGSLIKLDINFSIMYNSLWFPLRSFVEGYSKPLQRNVRVHSFKVEPGDYIF